MSLDDPARPLVEADRAAAVSRLRRAAEDGRLDPHELDRRVAHVQRARLAGELRSALHGLGPESPGPAAVVWPSAQVAQPPAAPVPTASAALPAPAGYRPDDRLSLSAGMSNEKRSGRWTIPPYVRVQAGFSTVKLDCRHAEPAGPVIDVEVAVGASNVVLVVPPGWGVDTDRLGKGIGTIKVKVPRAAAEGCPTLVLHGQLGVSTLIVRRENWVERRFGRADR